MRHAALAILVIAGCLTDVPPARSAGQEPHVCSVWVSQQGKDVIGGRVALLVKERINSSPLYRLSSDRKSSFFRIILATAAGVHHPDLSAVGMVFLARMPTQQKGGDDDGDWYLQSGVL